MYIASTVQFHPFNQISVFSSDYSKCALESCAIIFKLSGSSAFLLLEVEAVLYSMIIMDVH